MRWVRWGAASIPVAAGIVVTILTLYTSALPNPILYVHIDVGTAALAGGAALSAIAFAGLALWEAGTRRARFQVSAAHAQATEDRRRFLQRLDHELKNPLTAIRVGLANVTTGLAAPEQEALESVKTQVLRISRLTADLRKLTELETRPVDMARVDIAELLREAVALAQDRPEADARRLSLVLPQAPWPIPQVDGDWDLLLLATHNLLDNALKFTRPGDTIEVRAFEDGDSVAIEVADTGPGIPDEEAPRVWEELYRGEGARAVPGSGLGMALVRAIVERHGGEASVRSRLDQGTVVAFRLPLR